MKIATLQLDSQIGHVNTTIARANELLVSLSSADNIDLLVLPELAFTGYNFPSLEAITPYLEPTAEGVSTKWAIETAKRLECVVIIGYPERSTEVDEHGSTRNYNSTVTVGPDGSILATYRKSFLYYTDECWAAEGSGFYRGHIDQLGTITHGICMDINPKEFTAPWNAYEFANYCLTDDTDLIVLSTAWLTHTPREELLAAPDMPELDTIAYWVNRMIPLSTSAGEKGHMMVFANRCGSEVNSKFVIHTKNGKVVEMKEPIVNYAGSSCVLHFQGNLVSTYGMLGQGEEGVLVVDTTKEPRPLFRIPLDDEEDQEEPRV